MKILSVGPVFTLDEVQFQRLSSRLKEVSQFLDFEQCHAVPGKRVMTNQADQRRPPRGHPGPAGRDLHLIGGRRTFGLVQKDGYVRERFESTFNTWTDIAPIQAAVAATERRHGDRLISSCLTVSISTLSPDSISAMR